MRSSILLVGGFLAAAAISSAQVALTAGKYSQTFDGLGTGLPVGWSTYLGASATSLGVSQTFASAASTWGDTGGAFKNLAAADNPGFTGLETTADQNAATDRALGVRQTGTTGSDPGTAFAFNFKTIDLAVTGVSFSAQMLSVQTRSTTWLLQYGVGSNPTVWTTLATYADSGVFGTVRFVIPSTAIGNGLTNQSNAWLRVAAIAASTGTGSRDTFAIDDFEIDAVPAAVITTPPSAQTVVVGNPASFSVVATGTGTLTYKWRKNAVLITGNTSATTATLTLPAVTSADAGSYDVIVTDANSSVTSAAALLTVTKAAGTVSFSSLTAEYNGSPQAPTATTLPAGLNVTFTYDGGTTAPTAAGSYTVVATINNQDYTGSATGTFTITKAPVTVTLSPTIQTYDGTPRVVTATTSPAGHTATVTYDGSTTAPSNAGSYTVVGSVSEPNYEGSTTALLAVLPASQMIDFPPVPDRLPDATPFALSATASSGLPVAFTMVSGSPEIATLAGNVVTLTGATGTVTIRATQSGNGNYAVAAPVDRTFRVVTEMVAPRLTLQPVAVTAVIGDRVTLTAAADGTPAPVYQWLRDNAPIAGATSGTLLIPIAAVSDSGLYLFVASNAAGTASSIPVAVSITKRPQTIGFTAGANVPSGSSVTLSAIASSGLPVTITLVSGPGSLAGNILTGSGGEVVVRATQAGDATYAAVTVDHTFNFVTGGVTPFITSPPTDVTVMAGGNAGFRAAAVGTPAPTYQWQKNGAPIAGATGAALNFENVTLADAGRYSVVVTNAVGSATAAATLNVRSAPVIVTPPADQTVAAGATAQLAVEALGYPALAYQWRKDGAPLAGATSATLVLANARNTHAGRYDVIVSNELGSVTSAAATLTVDWRDFSGAWFGRFTGAAGDFVLYVRTDNTASFVGHLPGLQAGIAVFGATVDTSGNFNLTTSTLTPTASSAADLDAPATAAASQPVTIRGALNEITGTLTGAIPELGAELSATRAASTGPASAQAGFYSAALIGSADGRGYIVVAPDGQAYLFTASGSALDSSSGMIGSDGHLKVTTASRAAIDLGFTDGRVSGTAVLPGGITGTIAGVADTVARNEHLSNLSVRCLATPAAALITGFVITGGSSKQVLLRAAGPALGVPPFNLPNTLDDPTIQLYRGSTSLAQNDDWGSPNSNATAVTNATAAAGAFPFRQRSSDSALVRALAPGAYTVIISGGTGTVLAEVYEVMEASETPGTRRLANLSARGPVIAGSPLIAGFVISGSAPQRVLIRGVGPRLGSAPFNVAGALPNPQLTIFRGSTPVKTNDDWFRDPDATAIRTMSAAVGAFALPAQSQDAAILAYLTPGAYTAIVTGPANANQANANGVALIEIYEVAP